ncbi:hypothetical protein D9611_005638 [Ephemerocybe angulata]|uniref:Peptide-O-fucosyltransferase n=1 Tax=Ephemerocybe angulata TaxID=980116 RepID=A0A8H5F4J1_9AGAR|nr:hypothetical protein D9611_005638 [Tulosesus angulatus]
MPSTARRGNARDIVSRVFFNNYSTLPSSEDTFFSQEKLYTPRRKRRFLVIIAVSVLAFSAFGLFFSRPKDLGAPTALQSSTPTEKTAVPELSELEGDGADFPAPGPPLLETDIPVPQEATISPYNSSHVLNGPPTLRFRDNLRHDQKYITSWISAGWTNDVMTYINLIYLGIITDRIPIVAMFTPSHIGGSVPPIPFGEVFDVPRLREALRRPILEWWEVKNNSSQEVDELGCWNVWEAVQYREHYPRRSVVPDILSLDISYTKAPSWVKLIPNFEHDQHSTFWSLAILGFPEGHKDNLVPPLESPRNHVLLPPDEQLLCYDYLYYLCAQQPFEFNFDFSPAWRFVGQHMRWTPQLDNLVDQYARRAIGVSDEEATPKWIGIHIRHGDFANWCGDVPITDCFAPLPVIARRVQEVKDELLDRMGIVVENVIMTSDERNETWWEGVRSEGWFQVDHTETVERYGAWYPVLIDAGIQSGGVGFVGTDRSTMSIMARRRVESWHNGVVRMIKWGGPSSDDH